MIIGFKKNSIIFWSNLTGKSLATFAQLNAIYVVAKAQTHDDATLTFLLLSYSIAGCLYYCLTLASSILLCGQVNLTHLELFARLAIDFLNKKL